MKLVQQVSQGKDPKGRTLDPSPGLQSHDHFMIQPCFSCVWGGHFMNQSSFLTSLTFFKSFNFYFFVSSFSFILFLFSFSFWLHHVTCGILVPQPGIEPGSLAVDAWSLNH